MGLEYIGVGEQHDPYWEKGGNEIKQYGFLRGYSHIGSNGSNCQYMGTMLTCWQISRKNKGHGYSITVS